MTEKIFGKIHSIQSLGTLDGPGVRFVIFTQGCNLRCGCCHNPDTWNISEGSSVSSEELIGKAKRFKEYFGSEGGITVSGGEPLLQAKFVNDIFVKAHDEGMNTCLDTSGSILNEDVKHLLENTDRVLLDIKYVTDEDYIKYVGCSISKPLEFLEYLNSKKIPVTVRQVTITELNGDEESVAKLKEIVCKYECVEKIELLPFKKICKVKYDEMGIQFPFECYSTPSTELMSRLNKII
jgi:pyruvate formate lyase activating enzyme